MKKIIENTQSDSKAPWSSLVTIWRIVTLLIPLMSCNEQKNTENIALTKSELEQEKETGERCGGILV